MSVLGGEPQPLRVRTVDYHTAGEPFRIVVDGAPTLGGSNILERRAWAEKHADDVRLLLVNEPRGHADMYGCHVTEPDDEGAHFGAVFFHKDGYSTACGHGTIALATWAVQSGRVPAARKDPGEPAGQDPETTVVIDVPSGRVQARVHLTDGKVRSAVFRNVPAFVTARDLPVHTSAGRLHCDLSYGGAFYASVRAADVDCAVVPADLPRLIALGREVKWALNEHPAAQHPEDSRLSGVYGTIFWEPVATEGATTANEVHQRNVTVFADGEVDRSPCGSGTSARLALLDAGGALADGATLVHHSIIGTRFRGTVVGRGSVGERAAVVTEVDGSAHHTGTHEFVQEDDDELGTGFQLR